MAYSSTDNRFVLFGGWDGAALGETWIFNPQDLVWEKAATVTSPPARGDAAFAYDSQSDVFVLFGGWYESPPGVYHRFGDTWHFDLRNPTWVEVFPSVSPSPRSDSAFAHDSRDGEFVLFGGFDGSRYLGETWHYDARAVSWTNMTPVVEPPGRADGRMAYDSWHSRFLMFAGNDYSGPDYTFHHLNDTWTYSGRDNNWTEVRLGTQPAARDYAVFAFRNRTGEFLLHGGYGERVILEDLWAFNVSADAWREIRLDRGPAARFAAVGGYDSHDDLFLVFGGLGNTGLLADTWLLWIAPSGETGPAAAPLGPIFLATGAAAMIGTGTALLVRFRKARTHPLGRLDETLRDAATSPTQDGDPPTGKG